MSLTPRIVETWACPGFGNSFSLFLRLELVAKNLGKQPVIIPTVNTSVSMITIGTSEDDLRKGRFDLEFEPEVLISGRRRSLRREDFVVIDPSKSQPLPISVEIPIPVETSERAMPGFATPGEKWLTVSWEPSLDRRSARTWSRAFGDGSSLLRTSLKSEPIAISIPVRPNFTRCRN
jgi:hypothetical protein